MHCQTCNQDIKRTIGQGAGYAVHLTQHGTVCVGRVDQNTAELGSVELRDGTTAVALAVALEDMSAALLGR